MLQSRNRQVLVALLVATAVLAATCSSGAAATVPGGGHRIGLTGCTGTGGVTQQLGRLARRLPMERAGQDTHDSQSRGGTG